MVKASLRALSEKGLPDDRKNGLLHLSWCTAKAFHCQELEVLFPKDDKEHSTVLKALWALDKKEAKRMVLKVTEKEDTKTTGKAANKTVTKKKFNFKAARAASATKSINSKVQVEVIWTRWSLGFCGVLFDNACGEIKALSAFLRAKLDKQTRMR